MSIRSILAHFGLVLAIDHENLRARFESSEFENYLKQKKLLEEIKEISYNNYKKYINFLPLTKVDIDTTTNYNYYNIRLSSRGMEFNIDKWTIDLLYDREIYKEHIIKQLTDHWTSTVREIIDEAITNSRIFK